MTEQNSAVEAAARMYRKTALVKAEQFLPPHQIPTGCFQLGGVADVSAGHGEWVLDTMEGRHPLRYADYICTGPAGERWNVKRSIFEATYELASLPAASEGEAVEAMRAACIAAVRAEQKYEGSDFPVCNAIVSAIEAIPVHAPSDPEKLVAWQPIETAPKNGTTIDVWRDGSREAVYWGFRPHECGEMGQYCDSDWHSEKEPGWVCSTFGEFVGGKHDPFTHWMPIPNSPITRTSQIEGEA